MPTQLTNEARAKGKVVISNSCRLALAICILGGISSASAQTTHNLTIRRHSSIALSNSQADTILTDASQVLQVDDDGTPGTDDLSCSVTLARDGDVTPFSNVTAPAAINSQTDLDTVHAESSFVKVVDSITFCGAPGSYAGCAHRPGRSMIVVRMSNYLGIVWAHEFGHTTGLPHRTGQYPLMTDRPLAGDQRRVNQAECNSFIAGPPAIAPAAPESIARTEDQPVGSLFELVQAVIVDKVPYSYIARHDPAELPAILPLLFDLSAQQSWPTIATLIGILGDRALSSSLMDFIDADFLGANSSAMVRAKSSALISLGYMLNRTEDPQILAYLHASSQARTWLRAGAWVGRTADVRQNRVDDFREIALMALALSGHSQAVPILRSAANTLSSRKSAERNRAFVEDLIRTHSLVGQRGLAAYYAESP